MAFKMKGSGFYGKGNQSPLKDNHTGGEESYWDKIKGAASDAAGYVNENVIQPATAVASGVGNVVSEALDDKKSQQRIYSGNDLDVNAAYTKGKSMKEHEQDGKTYTSPEEKHEATRKAAADKSRAEKAAAQEIKDKKDAEYEASRQKKIKHRESNPGLYTRGDHTDWQWKKKSDVSGNWDHLDARR